MAQHLSPLDTQGDIRRREIDDLGALNGEARDTLDRVSRIASAALDMPIAHVSFLDAERQWVQAAVGISTGSFPIQQTFCIHTVERNELFVVEDAVHDSRFVDSPYVRSSPNVRFYAGAPLVSFNDIPIGTLCAIDRKPRSMTEPERQILVDLAALTINQLEVGRQALSDCLTGCWNRRMLARVFEAEQRRCARSGARFSLAALDLDHFKNLNDRYGHAAGDAVLVRFAELVRERLRPEDWLFRLGGEEFAVLISHTGSRQCVTAVDRLREAVMEAAPLATVAPVTFSAGVSEFGEENEDGIPDTLAHLLERADQALYMAKETGRNRVVRYPGRKERM